MHLDFDGSPGMVKQIIALEEKIQPVFGITIVPRLTVPNYRVKLEPNHFQLAKVLTPEKSDTQLQGAAIYFANLPPQDSQKFAQAWLTTACQEETIAKSIIQHSRLVRKLPIEVTDTDLRKWIQTHAECKPYQALAEKAIKNRAVNKP